MHDHGSGAPFGPDLLLPAVVATLTLAYIVLALRAAAVGGGRWPVRRSAVFVLGAGLVLWALTGPLAADDTFAAHMAKHLLVGMLGPFLMVLGAPMRLLLRWGPRAWRSRIGALLHARPVRFVAHPVVALILAVGLLPVVYATPLHSAATASAWGHAALHGHFLASGYLFAWVICGPDPAPARPSVPARLAVLGVAVAVHATVSQLMYAGFFPADVEPVDLRRGATLMYYGGDLVELALALVLVTQWRPGRAASAAAAAPGPTRSRTGQARAANR